MYFLVSFKWFLKKINSKINLLLMLLELDSYKLNRAN
jgi:hypothetical protein